MSTSHKQLRCLVDIIPSKAAKPLYSIRAYGTEIQKTVLEIVGKLKAYPIKPLDKLFLLK